MQKRIFALILALAMVLSLAACAGQSVTSNPSTGSDTSTETTDTAPVTTVGFIYIGNDSEAYTRNFIAAQTAIEQTYGDKVKTIAKYEQAYQMLTGKSINEV